MITEIRTSYLAGRCANGAERDGGTLYHAIPVGSWTAVCGARPGKRSAGWSESGFERQHEVTCPKCAKRIIP
jgi:hypothetical protein